MVGKPVAVQIHHPHGDSAHSGGGIRSCSSGGSYVYCADVERGQGNDDVYAYVQVRPDASAQPHSNTCIPVQGVGKVLRIEAEYYCNFIYLFDLNIYFKLFYILSYM